MVFSARIESEKGDITWEIRKPVEIHCSKNACVMLSIYLWNLLILNNFDKYLKTVSCPCFHYIISPILIKGEEIQNDALQLLYYDRQAVWQVYKELSESTCHRRAPYSVTVDTNCWVTPWGFPSWGEKRKEKTKMAGNQRGGGRLNDRERNNMKKGLERIPHRIKTNSKPHARSYITSTSLDQHVRHDKVQMETDRHEKPHMRRKWT